MFAALSFNATPGASAPTPFSGTPVAIPGTVQAANYDLGGEGIAYHDTTRGNTGGAYRADDVDLEVSSEGGYDVGWMAAGEWLNYSVSASAAGNYTAQIRVASIGGGSLHLGFNTTSHVWVTVAVPPTGGWQAWTTVSVPVTLGAGPQLMTLLSDTGGFNVRSITVVNAGGSSPAPSGLTPYSGSPAAVPGSIPAATFDNGGEGVAYHDTTSGNAGGAYRAGDVDIEASSAGGYDVGWIAAGEWLNYTVNVASAGNYTAQLRVASPNGASMHVGFNAASSVWQTVAVPVTGAWQTWTTISVPVVLGAGVQQMTLRFDTAGLNISSITIVSASSPVPPPGHTVTVREGDSLQSAIDLAQPGDTILLLPGVTYLGSFVLPAKSGNSYITIRSAVPDGSLPGPGVRMTPQYVAQLPKVQGGTAGMPAFTTAPGAHHYQLQFLEIVNTYAANDIVELGDGSSRQNALSVVPHDLVVDRCYLHGDATAGQKRGIALNSASTSIVNSYISDIKSVDSDSQAIAGWNGPGPYRIENNYLEATGENVLFGGADPSIPGLVPSDVTFRFNHVAKQPSWRGQGWTVKNLIELKNAQRVLIDRNVVEYSWAAGQAGYAFMLTPRNQDGTAPWSVVQHVQITNNIVRHVASAIDVLGLDTSTYQVTNDIAVRNNLFVDISKASWGGSGLLVMTLGGANMVFDHNTIFTDGTSVVYADVTPVSGFVFTNNILPDNSWAVMGSGASPGVGTLAIFYPGSVFRGNVLIGANAAAYPAGNYFPATLAGVGFVDPASGNYHLSASSPYRSLATDGTAIGCNVDLLQP